VNSCTNSPEDGPVGPKLVEIQQYTNKIMTSVENIFTYMIISHLILVRMRNVSDKIGRKNQNALPVFGTVFPKIVLFCEIIWKYLVEPERIWVTI